MNNSNRQAGFTLLEIVAVVAILGIVSAIAVFGYQKYIENARGSELVVKYDALRSTFNANTGQSSSADCTELAKRAGNARLNDDYATLDYGFEAVAGGGYRPVLTVCATADRHGALGISVARGAHDNLYKTSRVEKGAVITDTVVSFALPLTDGNLALCNVAPAFTANTCGARVAEAPKACPPGTELYLGPTSPGGPARQSCQQPCPAGQARSPGNPNPLECVRVAAQPGTTATQAPSTNMPPDAPKAENANPPGPNPCPAGQTADASDPAKCSAAPGTTTSSKDLPTTTPQGTAHQQCTQACRARYPHGNSNAYRTCVTSC